MRPPWKFALGLLLLWMIFVLTARAEKKSIDELGLDLITKIKIIWPSAKCEQWPDADGGYPCEGKFKVYPQGIHAPKKK